MIAVFVLVSVLALWFGSLWHRGLLGPPPTSVADQWEKAASKPREAGQVSLDRSLSCRTCGERFRAPSGWGYGKIRAAVRQVCPYEGIGCALQRECAR